MVDFFLQGKTAAGVEWNGRVAAVELGAGGRGLMGCPPARRERRGCHQIVRSVRPGTVVVLLVVGDHDLDLGQAREALHSEELVTDTTVERLNERVLPRAAGFDERGPGSAETAPVPQRVGGHCWSVVTPQALRSTVLISNDPVEDVNDPVGVDASFGFHRQGLAGELVHDVQQLDRTAVLGHVPLEIERPHMVRVFCAEPIAGNGGITAALAFATLGGYPQAFLAPEPLTAFAVHRPALIEQVLVGTAVPPPRATT